MTAINSLFGKMQPFVTNENVVFMFDPKVYLPVVAGCTPSAGSIIVLPTDNPGYQNAGVEDLLAVTYQLDGLQTTIFFYGDITYSNLLANMAFAINADAGANLIHVEGVSGATPFALVGLAGAYGGVQGGNGSASATPADLVLSLTPAADHDAVALLFGAAVTIHSCGPQIWEAT